MNVTKDTIQRILAALHGEAAPLIFDRSEKSFKAWINGPNGKTSTETLERILTDVFNGLPVLKAQKHLDDYGFLLKPEIKDAALRAYDECGDVEVTIRLNAAGSKVSLRKMTADIQQVSAPIAENEVPVPEEKTPVASKFMDVRPINGSSVMICIPMNKDVDPTSNHAIIAQFRMADFLFGHNNVRYEQAVNWDLDDARNVLAEKFLNSGMEWSFWMDSDMVAPTGNPAWYRGIAESNGERCAYDPKFLGRSAIEQLTRGDHKLVSAVYSTREKARRLVAHKGMQSKTREDEEFVKALRASGPRPGFASTRWFGFGCCAIHRDVFLDIQKACPELAPTKPGEPWLFFERQRSEGEDIAFCRHAIKSGHTPTLDTSVFALHIGRVAYRI